MLPVGQRLGGLKIFTACAWGSAGRLPAPLLRAAKCTALELMPMCFCGSERTVLSAPW